MAQLRILLLKNNYPNQVIEREFNKFKELKSKLNLDKIIDNEIKLKYLSLPYLNDKSELISVKSRS